MAGGRGTLTSTDHAARAIEHRRVADVLHEAGEEWSAVCYFYASLHTVKAALVANPIFADPVRLKARHHSLRPADAYCNRHRGYMKPAPDGTRIKIWGLSEIVSVLYPSVRVEYELLMRASVEVRYERGLTTTLPKLESYAERLASTCASGQMLG